MRALIIEDEALMVLLIEHELQSLGYNHFDVAEDEGQALAAIQRHCPDLITVDDWLVRHSTLDRLRAACPDEAIPAVHFGTFDLQNSENPETDAALPKIFNRQSLRQAIRKAGRRTN